MTAMYETFFNLNQRPFACVPRVERYYPAAGIEAARSTLSRCLERDEGVGLVVGAAGTGKTLLCQLLAEQFRGQFQVVLLSGGRLGTRRALLQAILYELGQPYRGMDEGELRLALAKHLTRSKKCPHGAVLLVDEAHALPLRLLDEVLALTNLAQEGQPRVRLVAAGNRILEERFASPKLESFNQRVVARCCLEALNRSETQDYIHAQIAAVGGNGPAIVPEEACQAVYKATDGVPRLINQLCDHALLLAYAAGQRQLDAAQVEEAWADLQQLPTPWNEQAAPSDNVIEFGGLEDESAPMPLAGNAERLDATSEATPPASPLHVMPETEELADAEVAGLEATEQLRQIQEMLADVQQEFTPAGSIGPEIELVFDDPAHPFQETFQHEEVIKDRYAIPAGATAGLSSSAAVPAQLDEPPVAPAWTEDAEAEAVGNDAQADAGPAPNIAAVRRRDFGRLFAKLRQG